MIRTVFTIWMLASFLWLNALGMGKIGSDQVLDGYLRNEVENRLASKNCDRIEGLWRLTGGGADVAIERGGEDGGYLIVVVEAPNRMLLPGTVVGTISAAGNEGMYVAKMFTRIKGDMMIMPKSFSVKLDEDRGLLEFMKNRSTFRINLWHFVPFLYRNSVSTFQGNAAAHGGAIRLIPEPDVPFQPVYL